MSDELKPCPKCGAAIPPEAPHGLCPKCLLAFVSLPSDAGQPASGRPVPPSCQQVAAAFPQLEILELIGQGGMGVVFKARQPKLDRVVALKILPQSLAADSAFAGRFTREGQVLARLAHPNIVTVHDFGQAGGFFYLLMEFVDGVNLRQAMKAGRFTPDQALAVVPRVCEALQYAHHEGVLHRDIKPENILLDARGRVKIADFGIAKLVGDPRAEASLTASGARLGTPHYMAPEQIENPGAVDHRADIYSLGVVFYEMLTGELPLGRFALPSEKSTADPRLDEVVLRSLEKEPARRQQNVGDVKTQVETIATTPGVGLGAAASPASTQPRLLKAGMSLITTPEHLGTFDGQFFVYRNRGQLRLDDQSLEFNHAGTSSVTFALAGGMTVRIPLAAVRDLSIGHYPRVMNPVGIDFISVTYDEGGRTRRLLFTPMEGRIGFPWSVNRVVADWFKAIREATTAATGRAPGNTPAAQLGTPSSSPALLAMFAVPLLLGASLMIFIVANISGPIGFSKSGAVAPVVVLFLVFAGLMPLAGSMLRRVRMARAHAGQPPSVNPLPAPLFTLIAAIIVIPAVLVVGSLVVYVFSKGASAPPEHTAAAPKVVTPITDVPSAPPVVTNANPPVAGPVAGDTRVFRLRHRLASQMAEDLRQILLGRPGHEASPSANNQEIVITAPPDVMGRVETFITVTDWPDGIARRSNFEYPNESVVRAARSFFHACAIEDSVEVFAKLLSPWVLATLKGDTKSRAFEDYQMGGTPDAAWEKSLRADWPGRQAAIEQLIREWNRYPLTRLTEDPGIAMGFGVKHFCSVSFEGAPKAFYQVTIEPDRTKPHPNDNSSFLFSSLPPWFSPAGKQESSDLREARARLAELRVMYGEQHPKVQQALARIKALEEY